jgi:hypothetical protein
MACWYGGCREVVAKLQVRIVNGDAADVDALVEFLRNHGHEANQSDEVEVGGGAGIGEVVVVVLGGVASAVSVAAQVRTWVQEYYARRKDRPTGVQLFGPDGKPLKR